MTANQDQPTPYADAAQLYRDAGWVGVIPVRGKYPPPNGWTGAGGGWPSSPDVYAWCEDRGFDNIGLRLPPDIIGIDVDAYGDKRGAATLADCEARWGPLPETLRSTSRSDGVSGIRLFTIPEGLAWPGQLPGGGVDLIRWDLRYCMSWPSVHPEGRVYRWTRDGVTFLNIPKPHELPALPQAWVDGLARGIYIPEVKAQIGDQAAMAWLESLNQATAAPCPFLRHKAGALVAEMSVAGGRHDPARHGMLDLVRLGEEGHPGILTGLRTACQAFLQLAMSDGTRDETEAMKEWGRLLNGAVAILSNQERTPSLGDPCIVLSDPPWHPGDPIPPYKPTPRSAAPVYPDDFLSTGHTRDTLGHTAAEQVRDDTPDNTWLAELDMTDLLAGRLPDAPPTELARTDGVLLLYAGKVNGLLGPSESGKTWIALLAAAQALSAGRNVIMLDFEDTGTGLVGRLRALGVADAAIAAHMTYISPAEPLSAATLASLELRLAAKQPTLIILDGVNAAMTTMGLDLMSNKDATLFHMILLLPLSRTGAAVVVVDHTPKNDAEGVSKGGIGAQAKRAAVTGAAIKVEVIKQFSRSHVGLLKLTVDKDRGGHVRMAAEAGVIGMAHLEPGPDGTLAVRIEPQQTSENDAGEFRPTTLMDRVADYLKDNPGSSLRSILGQDFGKDKYVKQAIEALVSDGFVGKADGPNRAILHSLIRVWPASVAQVWPSVAQKLVSGDVARGETESPPPGHTAAVGPHSGQGHTHQDHFDYPENDPADD